MNLYLFMNDTILMLIGHPLKWATQGTIRLIFISPSAVHAIDAALVIPNDHRVIRV